MTTRTAMTAQEIEALFEREFPEIHHGGRIFTIEEVGPSFARLRMDFHARNVRPGGTLSGPSLMTLADLALYVAILATIGPVTLAVTTNLNFNFLRKPPQRALVGEARLMKVGRRLIVGEVAATVAGSTDVLCHATGTYAVPSGKGA